MYTVHVSGLVLRRVNKNYAVNSSRLASFYGQCRNAGRFAELQRRMSAWMREHGALLARACTRQFEFVIAQRIRRTLQIFHLYTRIWDEVALKEFMRAWRRRMMRNTKQFVMSAAGMTVYDWNRKRISDEELESYKEEIEGIHRLKESTVVCAKCHLRTIIDVTQPGINYCKCYGATPVTTSNEDTDGWQPFIERQDMLIWKREEPNTGGLFAYKVYGSFSDVTADDFLQVQIDVDYRKKWDPTARELQIIDTDPNSEQSGNHSTDIIYWEMIWPKLFSNRDYVYQRRWMVDREKGLIVIISKVTEHPDAPTRPGVYRVTSYWSYMVITPYTEFHQPGIEFGLTYFDDPGINIPAGVTTWVAMSGLPDFLIRMRQASKDYKKYKMLEHGEVTPVSDYVSVDEIDTQKQSTTSNRRKTETDSVLKEEGTVGERTDIEKKGFLKFVHEKENADTKDKSDTFNVNKTEISIESRNCRPRREQGVLYNFFMTKLFT